MKTEFANGLKPYLLTSQVVDQVLKKNSACEPDTVWCLVPSRSTCLQICEDNVILGFGDTLFFGSSLSRCATSEFPPIGLMVRKNPGSLVFRRCPGCACEISSNICFACNYAEKDTYYADGFRKYSPNSPSANDNLHRDSVNSQGPIDNIPFKTFSHHNDDVEDYMLGYDPSDDVWS